METLKPLAGNSATRMLRPTAPSSPPPRNYKLAEAGFSASKNHWESKLAGFSCASEYSITFFFGSALRAYCQRRDSAIVDLHLLFAEIVDPKCHPARDIAACSCVSIGELTGLLVHTEHEFCTMIMGKLPELL